MSREVATVERGGRGAAAQGIGMKTADAREEITRATTEARIGATDPATEEAIDVVAIAI
jgi:hypothetical protein